MSLIERKIWGAVQRPRQVRIPFLCKGLVTFGRVVWETHVLRACFCFCNCVSFAIEFHIWSSFRTDSWKFSLQCGLFIKLKLWNWIKSLSWRCFVWYSNLCKRKGCASYHLGFVSYRKCTDIYLSKLIIRAQSSGTYLSSGATLAFSRNFLEGKFFQVYFPSSWISTVIPHPPKIRGHGFQDYLSCATTHFTNESLTVAIL